LGLPHDDILPLRKMKERFHGRQENPGGFRHLVAGEFRLGGLQRPRRMVNLSAQDLS
jgi:hypothetical protein